MASDFFQEEADPWRVKAWDMIRWRPDVTFSLLTKRAERIKDCLPYDWVKKVYDACVENDVQFVFGQTGNIFIKDGKEYKIRNRTEQMVQALKSGLNHPARTLKQRSPLSMTAKLL